MKKRFATFLVGLSMVLPAMTGCGSSNGGNPFVPGGNPAGPGGGNGSVTEYKGSNTKIGTIPNVPVKAYSDKTEQAIHRLYTNVINGGHYIYYEEEEEAANQMIDYMLALGVGENVANAFCSCVTDFYHVAMGNDSNGKEFVKVCYDALKILNSLDYSKIASLLEKVNSDYDKNQKREAEERLNSIQKGEYTILDYVGARIQNVSYGQIKELKSHMDVVNSSTLRNAINQYDSYFSSYQITQAQRDRFNEYKANLAMQINTTYAIIPSEFIAFIKKQAGNIKSVLVNDLKLIVDAFGETIFNIIYKRANSYDESSARIYDVDLGGSYYFSTANADNYDNYGIAYFMEKDIFATLIQNRAVTLGLLKAIYTDSKMGSLLLDYIVSYIIPSLKQFVNNDQESLRQIEALRQKVSALSPAHIASLANLIITIMNQVSNEDYNVILETLMPGTYGIDYGVLLNIGDKYVSQFDKVLSSISGRDKSNILAIGQIFGVDIISELQEFLKIYANKNLYSEAGYEKFQEDVMNWLNRIYTAFRSNFAFIDKIDYEGDYYGGGSSGNAPSSSSAPTSPSIGGGYYLRNAYYYGGNPYGLSNSELASQVYLYFTDSPSYYDSYNSFSCYVSDLSYYLDEYNYYVNNYGRDYARDYFGSFRAGLFEYLINCNFTSSDIIMSINNQTVGTVPYTISIDINGIVCSFSDSVECYPRDLIDLRQDYIYGGEYYQITCQNGYNHVACEMNSTYLLDYSSKRLGTSKEGWNCFFDDAKNSYLIYYVIDSSKQTFSKKYSYKEIGVYIQGEDSFDTTPYCSLIYSIDSLGITFSKSNSLKFDQSYVRGKAAGNKYSVSVDGIDYEFVVVSKDKPYRVERDFTIRNVNYGVNITNPTTVAAELTIWSYYRAIVDDVVYFYETYNTEADQVQLTNFTYINGEIKFTFNGEQFSFIRNDY